MNVFHNTINKKEVKQYASFVLLSTLKLEAITEKTKVETLIDILIGAAMRGSSIEQTCQQHEDAPCGKTIRTHLEQQIESIKDAEVRINRGLRKNIPKQLLRKPIKVAMDCVEIGYYGMPDGPNVLRTSKPKDGTSMFHTYCTAYVVEKGERYTLAMTYVMKDDSMFDVVRRLNKRLIQLGIKAELYLFDRGYYSVQVVRWLIKYNKPFIIPVRVFGKKAKGDKPATGMRRLKKSKVSFWERYAMHSQEYGEVTFDVAVCCDNFKGKKSHQGKGKRHGRRTLVYATYGVKDHSFA